MEIYADTAKLNEVVRWSKDPRIGGFTTNPVLMRKAGVTDYEAWARSLIAAAPGHCFSVEVLADDFAEMTRQARLICSWGANVYAKIPSVNSQGMPTYQVVKRLDSEGLNVNVTAVTTLSDVAAFAECFRPDTRAIVSLFVGRITDTWRDPESIVGSAMCTLHSQCSARLLWASVRDVTAIEQARRMNVDIITAPPNVLEKLDWMDRSLNKVRLDTVREFYEAGKEYTL